jgi:hypothetical protein
MKRGDILVCAVRASGKQATRIEFDRVQPSRWVDGGGGRKEALEEKCGMGQ